MSHLVAQSKHAGIKAHNGLNNKEKLVRKTVVAPPNKAKICIQSPTRLTKTFLTKRSDVYVTATGHLDLEYDS